MVRTRIATLLDTMQRFVYLKICIMLLLLILTLISTSSVTSDVVEISANTTDIYRGYRLPANQIPSKYSIYLKVDKEIFSGNAISFNGRVEVTFTVTENINQVQLHSGVTINNLELKSAEGSIPHVNITSYDTVATSTILFVTYLNASTEYTLTINYTGEIDTTNMQGFYRSSYKNESGATEYLVTTQLQASNARKVFPCFDEPHYKAKFHLQITYPRGLNAISNTPQNGIAVLVEDDYETATFIETPVMSTYLLAFTVSNFTCTIGEFISDNIPHRVCSRPETESERSLAVEYGTKLLRALGEYLGIPYSEMMVGKMDQLAIPDFSAGAMENWGMVTYKESALLYNPNETSQYYKQRVISIIAHEFTHMWFGNLVTLDWWDFTFLNEGFARYFQYFIQTKIPELEEYEMDKQFVVEVQQSVFLNDALNTSDSLTSKAASPSEITGKFGKISYHKGASVIKMVESLMPETFSESLQTYLRQNKFSTTLPNVLWNVLSNFVPVENLPSNTNFSEVMDNWTNKAGFPLVTVTANGTDIILTQERFLYSGSDYTRWYIPINYTVFNGDNMATMTIRTWMVPGNNQTIIPSVLSNNSWVIVNPKGSGYYRVHYDNIIWSKIELTLQSNRRAVDNVTRSQIIDDVLNLARARKLSYSNAFKMLSFLRNETCYYPWHSAIEGFNYLLSRLGEQSILGGRVRSMQLELMESVKIKTPLIGNIGENNHMYALKVLKILTTTCKLADEFCVSYSKELFQQYKNGISIDKDLRSVVYCNALRYSTNIDSDWNFLWNKLQNTSQADGLYNIITSLGCTKNATLLEYYLEQSVNSSSGVRIQNIADVWESVYTSSTEGVDAAFNYFSKNYERIQKYFSRASNLLPGIVDRFSSNEQIQKLEEFISQQSSNSSMRTDLEKLLRSARDNLEWVSSIESDLNEYFKIVPSASPAIGCGILVPIIISTIFIIKIII